MAIYTDDGALVRTVDNGSSLSLNGQLAQAAGALSLQWDAALVQETELLTTDTTSLAVEARPAFPQGISAIWVGGLTIAVTVVKSPLDLRGVTLDPTKGYVGDTEQDTRLLGAETYLQGAAVIEYKASDGTTQKYQSYNPY